MNSRLAIGKVLSSHGVRGEAKVQSYSGEDGHFRGLERVWLRVGNRELEMKVAGVRGAKAHLIMALEGLTSPEDVRKYQGAEILVEREHGSVLEDGEYYIADLVGCELIFSSQVYGTVVSVWENVQCDMLEAELQDGRMVQIPLQDMFVGAVDIEARRIELKVDWILE